MGRPIGDGAGNGGVLEIGLFNHRAIWSSGDLVHPSRADFLLESMAVRRRYL